MILNSILSSRRIAISVSESEDITSLGFGHEHLVDATIELSRHLLALGAGLRYGGDLRAGGFTELFSELHYRHRQNSNFVANEPTFENFLAWPVHISFTPRELEECVAAFDDDALRLILLTRNGERMSLVDRRASQLAKPTDDDWSVGLTAMRLSMNNDSFARIVLGGRLTGYRGRMPGIAEESLIALDSGLPLFVVGAFGGCAGAVASALGLAGKRDAGSLFQNFEQFSDRIFANGLGFAEQQRLASTPHIDEAATLIVRGLLRIRQWNSSL